MIKGIIFDWVGTLSKGSRDLFPYSEKVLKKLKKRYKLGLVTLAGHGNEKRKEDIKATGVEKYFDSIIIDVVKNKEMYLRSIEEMKTAIKTTIIVDDRMSKGIKLGNEIGCITYWIQKGPYANDLPNKETGQPTKIINSVGDLLKIL